MDNCNGFLTLNWSIFLRGVHFLNYSVILLLFNVHVDVYNTSLYAVYMLTLWSLTGNCMTFCQ